MNETIDRIIHYWFGDSQSLLEINAEKSGLWWSKDASVDQDITERFEQVTRKVIAGELSDWQNTPRGLLALILCTDQFPRNMYRNTPGAFDCDALALSYVNTLLDAGAENELRVIERVFCYLPFEHSEKMVDQNRAVSLYEALVESGETEKEKEIIRGYLRFAIKHRDFIQRFGRFPHRNVILGRLSTEEEREFLLQPGSSF
ncbi:MAG: DUF924 family protein [Gammaproteobacteria bacterium]|nr:DUF924 family protein [Gammaproteobacteria bacterium]